MAKIRTHYDNLKVARNADAEVIKASYRVLTQKWHPDKNQDNLVEAERNTKLIREAYEVLSDPQRKQEHDNWIQEQEDLIQKSHFEHIHSNSSDQKPKAFDSETQNQSQQHEISNISSFDYFMKAIYNYANFSGRARRKEFWFFVLYFYLILMGISLLFNPTIAGIYVLGLIIPTWALIVRRLHDVNRSGWWILSFYFAIGAIFLILEGSSGTNDYGKDPRQNLK